MSALALTEDARRRAARIRLIVLDVDGVLTDGRLYYGPDGEALKAFDVRDGHGIKVGQLAGLEFAIVTGRRSGIVAARAEELGIREVHQRIFDKSAMLDEILGRVGIGLEETCFVGDDLIDVPAMRRVGLAAAPADAMPEAREVAQYVTSRAGGRGAVREVIDAVLQAGDRWRQATERWLG